MGRPKKKGQTCTTAIRLRPWTKGALMREGDGTQTADEILTAILTKLHKRVRETQDGKI